MRLALRLLFPKSWRRDWIIGFRRYIRALLYTFNVHTMLLSLVACVAVYLSDKYNFRYNMDFTLVATGTTFPLVFTIQQAFTRRERALFLIANLKASVISLYWMHRDWSQGETFPDSIGNDHTLAAKRFRSILLDFLTQCKEYLTMEADFESYAEKRLTAKNHHILDFMVNNLELSGQSRFSFQALVEKFNLQDPVREKLRSCYRLLSRIAAMNEHLGLQAGYTKGGEGGMSRTNQYLRYVVSNLEELRMIKDYRTPIMMRYAVGVLLHIFPLLLAPYFSHFCDSWISTGHEPNSCPAGYAGAISYVTIVMLLFNIQQDIELPFDMKGLDDIFFELPNEVEEVCEVELLSHLTTRPPSPRCTDRTVGDPVQLKDTANLSTYASLNAISSVDTIPAATLPPSSPTRMSMSPGNGTAHHTFPNPLQDRLEN